MREMELNRCRDFVADEIGKSSVELEASNAACQACLEEAGKHMQDDKADHPRIIELKKTIYIYVYRVDLTAFGG